MILDTKQVTAIVDRVLPLVPASHRKPPPTVTDAAKRAEVLTSWLRRPRPDPRTWVGDLMAAPLDELDDVLARAGAERSEAIAVQEIAQAGLRATAEAVHRRALDAWLDDLAPHLETACADACELLRNAAAELPDDAFDPAAVLAADAGSAYRTAQLAIDQLLAISAARYRPGPDDRLPERAYRLTDVLGVITVERTGPRIHGATGDMTPNVAPNRNRKIMETMRACREIDALTPADILVGVARDRWPGVVLEWNPDPRTTAAHLRETWTSINVNSEAAGQLVEVQ